MTWSAIFYVDIIPQSCRFLLMLRAFQGILILFTATACLCSCSMKYNRDWKKVASSTPAKPTDLSGAWEGTWTSLSSGHHGRLRAIATPISIGQNQPKKSSEEYEFRYHAIWAKILSGGYTTRHTVKKQQEHYTIGGEHDLGRLFGGKFTYEGTATPVTFKANYFSNLDNGVFQMARPDVPAGESSR